MKIYLQDENNSWILFENPDAKELIKRNITIGNNTRIGFITRIGNNVSIGDYADIGNNVSIGDYADIDNNASIGDDVSIGDYARIGNNVSIGYNAHIGDFAQIEKGINLLKSIYIAGSKHSITYVGNNKVSIGCHTMLIAEWLQKYQEIGNDNKYNKEQINEYLQYIQIIKQMLDNNII